MPKCWPSPLPRKPWAENTSTTAPFMSRWNPAPCAPAPSTGHKSAALLLGRPTSAAASVATAPLPCTPKQKSSPASCRATAAGWSRPFFSASAEKHETKNFKTLNYGQGQKKRLACRCYRTGGQSTVATLVAERYLPHHLGAGTTGARSKRRQGEVYCLRFQ